MSGSVSRRTVVKGAAWAVPVVSATAAAPALAASAATTCGATKVGQIDSYFTTYKTNMQQKVAAACPGGYDLMVWYDGTGGTNGVAQNSVLNVRNLSSCTLDLTQTPMLYRIDVKNLSGTNYQTTLRNFTYVSSYGDFYPYSSPGGALLTGVRYQSDFQATGTATWSNYFYAYQNQVPTGQDTDITWSWGGTQGITSAYELVPLGFAPPQWSEVKTALGFTDDVCYQYYLQRYNQWISSGEGCFGVRYSVATKPTCNNVDSTTCYTKTSISCGSSIYSNVSGDTTPAHDGIY